MKSKPLNTYAMNFLLVALVSIFTISATFAGERDHGYRDNSSVVNGWRLGPDRGRDGYAIFRSTRGGWQRVPGSAVQIGGTRANPWVINTRNRIFYWNGHDWDRMPGSAIAVADGWSIGTNREHGGYGIYRWNGYRWEQAPGGAVTIGGSYDRPWVINDRNQRFVWNGYDWDRVGGRSFGPSRFNSFGDQRMQKFDQRQDRYRSRRDRRRW